MARRDEEEGGSSDQGAVSSPNSLCASFCLPSPCFFCSSLLDCACGGSSRSDDLQFLIAKGVDLDDVVGRSEVGGESGRSALMAACQYGSQFGVEALVRAGADVDLRNELGVTALMMAVSYGQVGIVSFLLDHSGASPALVDASGHSALSYAYERGHASIASKLVKSLALPPARITTIAREKLIESRRKAEEAARQEREDKKALLARTIAEVKQAEADERK